MAINDMQQDSDAQEYGGDQGDENDSGYEECERRINALASWAQSVGAKLGIPFSDGGQDDDPLKAAIAGTKGALGS